MTRIYDSIVYVLCVKKGIKLPTEFCKMTQEESKNGVPGWGGVQEQRTGVHIFILGRYRYYDDHCTVVIVIEGLPNCGFKKHMLYNCRAGGWRLLCVGMFCGHAMPAKNVW